MTELTVDGGMTACYNHVKDFFQHVECRRQRAHAQYRDDSFDMKASEELTKRERQIVETLYTLGEGSARDVAAAIDEPEAYDTVRVTLGLLERRGLLRRRLDGKRHIYTPAVARATASKSAWRRLTRTFFGGSPGRALISFLDASGDRIADDELDELARWVNEQSRKRKRR